MEDEEIMNTVIVEDDIISIEVNDDAVIEESNRKNLQEYIEYLMASFQLSEGGTLGDLSRNLVGKTVAGFDCTLITDENERVIKNESGVTITLKDAEGAVSVVKVFGYYGCCDLDDIEVVGACYSRTEKERLFGQVIDSVAVEVLVDDCAVECLSACMIVKVVCGGNVFRLFNLKESSMVKCRDYLAIEMNITVEE